MNAESESIKRPEYYEYAKTLIKYLFSQRPDFKPFDGNPIFPRQLEVHVPNNGPQPCNFYCKHCQGKRIIQTMTLFDNTLLALIKDLDGCIPLFVFSGAYTEPTLNMRLLEFISEAKIAGSRFGLHTHGALLADLEEEQSFVTRLCQISDKDDYITISLDAGSGQSYAKTKRTDPTNFEKVIRALELLRLMRARSGYSCPKVRITYLMNKWNSGEAEIANAVAIARSLKVDSLRFSIPYAPYGTPYEVLIRYKYRYEVPFYAEVKERIRPMLSADLNEKPYIFFLPPDYQDVEYCFTYHCFYGYFQITVGADGYLYRCSSAASPSFPGHRLGRLPSSAAELLEIVHRNQDIAFDPLTQCKRCGARCNRAAIDVNRTFEARWFE